MRKIYVTLSIIILIVLMSSCSINSKHANIINSKPISEKQAVEIVAEKIGTNGGTRKIEIDKSEKKDNKEYFVVHAYSLGKANEEGISMSFTYGWYYVDKFSKKVFELDLGNGSKLIPLN